MRVIAGVHYGTADCRTNAHVSLLTCLTDLNSVVLDVADLSDGCLALKTDITNLAGGESYLSDAVLLRDELCCNACSACELCALTGVELDVVDNSTYRNVLYRKCVTGLDIIQ